MARTVAKLSPAKVSAALRAGLRKMLADGGNLYLQVTGPGNGSWIFRYAERGSGAEGGKTKTRWMGLGACHTIGLATARDKARTLRERLTDGIDPMADRRQAKAAAATALTFDEVAELYITSHEAAWRSQVHARQWRSSLRDHASPIIGPFPVSMIGTAEVMRVLDPIWRVKPETASRVRQRIEAIIDYAKARGWREGENPARWRGHLEALLPAKEKVAPVQHHPAMPWKQVPVFMEALAGRQGMAARALVFLILTGVRSAEARGATWGEIDAADATWTIPGSRMKAGKPHRVPLTHAALAVLQDIRPEESVADTLVFPGAKGGKPLSDVAMAKLLPAGATAHGFRSSFRTWAGETTNFSREVVEMALAHRTGDSVEQAYARGDLFDRRRKLMEAWTAFCMKPTETAFQHVRSTSSEREAEAVR